MPHKQVPLWRVLREHARPEVDAHGVPAPEGTPVFDERARFVEDGPVGRGAGGGCAQRRAKRRAFRGEPSGVFRGEAAKELRRRVARIEGDATFAVDEARAARKTDGAHRLGFVQTRAADEVEEGEPLFAVGVFLPEAPRFEERVGDPEVGVGRVVCVDHAPTHDGGGFLGGAPRIGGFRCGYNRLAPEPGGKVFPGVSGAEVVDRPAAKPFKELAVVVDEREEESVGLSFARRDLARVARIDETAFSAYGFGRKAAPGAPGEGSADAVGRRGHACKWRRKKGGGAEGLKKTAFGDHRLTPQDLRLDGTRSFSRALNNRPATTRVMRR